MKFVLQKIYGWISIFCNLYFIHQACTNVVNFLIDFTGFVFKILLVQVFQCLLIGGENAGKNAIRNAEGMVVTSQEFKDFCERHKNITSLVPESNEQVILIIQLSITVTKIGLHIYIYGFDLHTLKPFIIVKVKFRGLKYYLSNDECM